MKAIIPAAGYATRLYPLTQFQPKHLLPIVGRPVLSYVIEKIEAIPEIDEIIIVTNNKYYKYFLLGMQGYKGRLPIKVINDGTTSNENRLGAIGDIKFVLDKEGIGDDILIIAGDNIFDFDLVKMHKFFLTIPEPKALVSLYDVKSIDEAKKYGVVKTNGDGKITSFVEKPEKPTSTLASTAIYFYSKRVLPLIGKYLKEGNSPDAPGHFLQWLHKVRPVYGFVFDKEKHDWLDIGDLKCYELANTLWESKMQNK